MNSPAPFFVFGFDAADPALLVQWAREGAMPALASVLERGAWGYTGGVEMVSEHGIWHTLLSGTPRGRHGCYYFRQLKPGTYDLAPFTGQDVRAAPFWSHLKESTRVAILDAPDIPLARDLDGIQLMNWATHRGWVSSDPFHQPASHPKEFLTEAERIAGARMEIIEDTTSTPQRDHELLQLLLQRVKKKGALCRHALKNLLESDDGDSREKLRITVFVFGESHTASHQFWKYRDGAPNPVNESNKDLRDATRKIYSAIDRELSTLLAMLPAEANVCVLSSLGMEPHFPYGEVTATACRELGYQIAPDARKQKQNLSWKPIDIARRVLPESIRVAASRRLSRDAREKLFAENWQRSIDWSRSRAFCIPSFFTGFIRVNLQGREPQGIVSREEYSALLDAIARDFMELRDAVTNEKIVRRVWRASEVFGEEPPFDEVSALPDLLIDYAPSLAPRERISHPRVAQEIKIAAGQWRRDSDHSQQGFWAFAGPQIQACGHAGEISTLR